MCFPEKNFKSAIGIDFIPARLTEGKEWYVSYYAIYPGTGRLRRKKHKLNRIQSITERRKMGRRLAFEINCKLSTGWNPFIEETAPKSFHKFFDVIETYMNVQKRDLEDFSYRSYSSMIKRLKRYLLEKGYEEEKMYVYQFGSELAAEIMLKLKQDAKISARTYNNYLFFFKAMFGWLKSFNYCSKNPFDAIKKMPKKQTAPKQRILLTKKMLSDLKIFLLTRNKRYLAMVMLCYYCFVRPNEITYLKLKDIDLERQIIYIRAEHAKNDNDSKRTIPDAMMPYLTSLNWNGSPDMYAFSWDTPNEFNPGIKHTDPIKIAKYWIKIRSHLKWPKEVQFYNLKHTGITNMLADGIAPNFVQGQADHHSLEMTATYAATRTPRAQEDIRTKVSAF